MGLLSGDFNWKRYLNSIIFSRQATGNDVTKKRSMGVSKEILVVIGQRLATLTGVGVEDESTPLGVEVGVA
jgi:hypothetical protein